MVDSNISVIFKQANLLKNIVIISDLDAAERQECMKNAYRTTTKRTGDISERRH